MRAARPRAGFKPPTADELFTRLDKNKDGKLTKDEVPARMWERFTKSGLVKGDAVTKEAFEAQIKKMQAERAKTAK
jgi:hypothetical protein